MRGLLPGLRRPDSDSNSEELPIVLFPEGIKVLYDGPDAAVDICFVHGLNGDRERTWTANRQSAPWPKTLLPSELEDARIFVYGYDAARCGASSRPLIFVAHSLGGLVCKKAILLSRNNPEPHLRSIFEHTKGVLFMGTPHRGSWLAYWANLSASVLGLVKSANRSLLTTLQQDDQLLETIQCDFWAMVREQREAGRALEVTCFFEGLPSSVLGKTVTVVSKESATLEGYSSFSIHADHRDMVRYGSAEDNGFKRLLGELTRWRDQARDSAASQPPSTEAQIHGPFGSSFYNYGGDQVNAPGGIVNISRGSGSGIHLPGATFHGPVSFGVPGKDRQVDEVDEVTTEKAACLRFLGFRNIDVRQHDIAAAYPGTCDWLFGTAQFRKWRDRADLLAHNGVLWIKGKPGAGKSTLMKHALRHCEEVFDDHLIVAYFFNARGEILEKTPLGMLRSIVYQLLDKDDTLYERFRPIYKKQRMHQEGEWAWPRAQLEDFIRSVVNKRQSKPLLLLVDALDECDDRDVRDVVGFLELLSIKAVQAGVTLRTCLSSRHYPNVSMRKTLELTVEASAEHERDIATYIEQRLEGHDDDIKAKVRGKAGGIFMWVVIVVSLLNQAYDDGRLEAMRKALEEVPADLEEVFNKLLGKADPNKAETIRMLQWVLLSRRPLKPEELFFAVLAGTAPEYSGPWDRLKITMAAIQRRITASSKGLVEARTGNAALVQFIHLSVNDFLLRNKRLQTLDPTLEPDPISASHGQLWDRCRSFIQQQDTTSTSEQHMRQLSDNYPFLQYAACYVFDHAEKALSGGAMREEIVRWLQMRNDWFEWWKRYLSTVDNSREHAYPKRNIDAGLLYVLSIRGHQKLVTVVLAGGNADVNTQGGEYGNALQVASYHGHAEIVRQLLEHGADVNAQGGRLGNALQAAAYFERDDIIQQLLERGADVNAQGGLLGNALQAAASEGYTEVVRQLLELGADVNAQGGRYGNALQAASNRGHVEIIQRLLERGADVNAQGGYYGNALQAASAGKHAEIVRLLLERGADVNAQGGYYGSALEAASVQNYGGIMRLLLEHGADAKPPTSTGPIAQTKSSRRRCCI
ncbi:ankyrin repeat domain-containing protein [Magnaporthiopsis poae ATCC 64411]|uniref:Ankyrin repeat domain-containing protein n=1 Tax=Magnaporthiopsis poae (strain ATCC 64411 / 73-15) TaxID=644358 RepID=A0A0C4E7S3_MAGP6|nr:ankyrin repeat domain-containing protein [Magnaporthiopsis poae ATCC 64411]